MVWSKKLCSSFEFYYKYDKLKSVGQYMEIISHSHISLFPDEFYNRHKDEIEGLIQVSDPTNEYVDVNLSMLKSISGRKNGICIWKFQKKCR